MKSRYPCMVRAKKIPHFRVSMSRCLPSEEEACAINECIKEGIKEDGALAKQKCLIKMGYSKIGSGASRDVYEKGSCILKLDHMGGANNEQEIRISEKAPKELRDKIVPVVAYSNVYNWLIMPKAKTGKALSGKEIDRIADQLDKSLLEANLKCTDFTLSNVGKLENKPVIIDYGWGITCRRSGKHL